MDLSSAVALNNGVKMPWLGLGVWPVCAGQRNRAGRALGAGDRLPAHGHGGALRERGGRGPSGAGQRRCRGERVRHHEGVELRPGVRADAEGIRRKQAEARCRRRGPLPHPLAPIKGIFPDTWKALEKL